MALLTQTCDTGDPVVREDGRKQYTCATCGHVSKWLPATSQGYARKCGEPGVYQPPDPGAELKSLIGKLGIRIPCKDCAKLAKQMKKWGVDGCRKHRAEIVKSVSSRVGEADWLTITSAALRAPFTFALNPLDPIGSMVDAAIEAASQKQWVTIAPPPSITLSPTSNRAIVTVAMGRNAQAVFALTRPYMERYAKRIGADLVVLDDWAGHPGWPISCKFGIYRALDFYERIAYLDVDILLREGCVNVFDLCGPDEFGFVDELSLQYKSWGHHIEDAYHRWRKRMGMPELKPLPWYLNSGVMVVPRSHRSVMLPPTEPILRGYLVEQEWFGARLQASGLPYRLMDRRANYQHWHDKGFREAPWDAVLHFSSLKATRLEEIRRWVAAHPLDRDPTAIDVRHRDWIRAVLMTGKFRRVLEIGCHKGYSTQAFLDALDAGAIDELHLCEPNPTPELLALIEGKSVTLHRCTSLELLAADKAWDLVFADGDHSEATVIPEATMLLQGSVRAVFAHDVTADSRHYNCDGARHYIRLFKQAGYQVIVGNTERPNEMTDRGMMFAVRDADPQWQPMFEAICPPPPDRRDGLQLSRLPPAPR